MRHIPLTPLRPRRGGFTLIELLVVIAIIALLAAILFPVFAQARERARLTTGMSDGKQLTLAILQYVQDNDETLPFGGQGGSILGGSVGVTDWQESCYTYIKSEAAYKDPDDPSGPDAHDNDPSKATGTLPGSNAYKYSASSFLMNGTITKPTAVSGIQTRRSTALAGFDAPAQFILLMEGQRHAMGSTDPSYFSASSSKDHNGNYASVWKAEYANGSNGTVEGGARSLFGIDSTGTVDPNFEPPFHKQGEIFTYLDGHVKFQPLNMGNPIADLKVRLPWCTYGHLPQNDPTCKGVYDWNDADS